jgi:trigger factor
MKIAVEEISPVKKSIKIEIPEDVVNQEFSHAYADLNRRVHVPGFRPGKAPLSILEKKYAKTIEEDVIRRLVPDYYQRAVKEAQLTPVELPIIEKVELKKNAPMTFLATVEIKPAIRLGTYFGLKLPRPAATPVKEADVEKTLQVLRERQAVLEACTPDHAIEENDYVLLDFQGSIHGQPFEGGSGQGVMVKIGSKTFVAGFEEQLVGHKAGEEVKIQITFPPDYRKPELAGKEAVFQVTLREIKKQVLPDLDDEFAKDLGQSSLNALRSKIQEDLSAQLKKEEERARKSAVLKRLIELHPFEAPPSLIEREVQDMMARVAARLPRGMTPAQAGLNPQAMRAELEPAAVEKVKGRLILETIADHEGLAILQEELEDSLNRMAQDMKVAVEDLKRLILSREGSLEGLRAQLREEKALDLVHSKTTFE